MFKLSIRTQIIGGFLLAMLLLLLLGYISHNYNAQYQATSKDVTRSTESLYHAQEILNRSWILETSQRGYTITHDTLSLQPYHEAVARYRENFDQLAVLTAGNAEQRDRVDTIRALFEKRINFANRIILARAEGFQNARVLQMTHEGQRLTNDIRQVISNFQEEEKAVLKQRSQKQASLLALYNYATNALFVAMAIILFRLLVLIYKNLRARTKAEELLKRTSDEIKDLYNNAPCGYHSLNPNGVIVDMNDTLIGWLGYDRDQVLQVMRFRDLLTEPCKKVFQESFAIVKERGFVNNVQLDLVRKDGVLMPVLVNSTAIYDEQGNFRKSRSSVFDIMQIKQMEHELNEARQVAERANQTKGMFLANMSHEIRTPLNAVIGLSHLALKTDLAPKQFDYLKKIQTSSESLLGIVNDILDFSKIESGKMTLEEIDFDLEEVFQKLADMVTYKAQAKGLEIAFGMDNRVPTHLVGDPVRLEQVLSNLCSNAVKFTDKGEVVVSVSLKQHAGEKLQLRFDVRDTGIGMDAVQLGKLFKPFSQADESITRKFGGTGLGLSIIKSLVELMGGDVSVQSEPGKGSVFSFTVWLKKQKFQRAIAHPAADLRHVQVLIVDDNETSRNILHETLKSFAFDVTALDSGMEAVHFLKNRSGSGEVRLVLMDWNMPGMDGLQTARIIRQDPSLDRVRIIMMCNNYVHESLYQKAEELSLSGILTKPVRHSVLYDTIVNTLQDSQLKKGKHRGPVADKAAETRTRGHLLLVEDNEINQQVASEILTGAGYTVEIAVNGIDAVRRITQSGVPSRFDLVLMDLQMPLMGGVQATREIRKTADYKDLPIIALTADAMTGVRERCIDAGMMDFVTKPINPRIMLETIEPWISRSVNTHTPATPAPQPAATAPAPATVPLLDPLPGINLREGVYHLGGNTKLYFDLLGKFLDKQSGFIDGIRSKINDGRKDEYMRAVHTMKGLSANLGMHGLHEACKKAEPALADDASTERHGTLLALETEMNIVLQSLREHLTREPGAVHQQKDGKVKHMIFKLEKLLKENDPEAIGLLKEISQLNGYEKKIAHMQELLDHYEFDQALDMLTTIKAQLY